MKTNDGLSPAAGVVLLLAILQSLTGCSSMERGRAGALDGYTLDFATPVDGALQAKVEAVDARLREAFGMTPEQTAVGVLDLQRLRLAMIHPDRIEYAASVPKIGILPATGCTTRRSSAGRDGITSSSRSPSIRAAMSISWNWRAQWMI